MKPNTPADDEIVLEHRRAATKLTREERIRRGEISISLVADQLVNIYLEHITQDPVFVLDTTDGEINVQTLPRKTAAELMPKLLFASKHIEQMRGVQDAIPIVVTGDCWGVFALEIPELNTIGDA